MNLAERYVTGASTKQGFDHVTGAAEADHSGLSFSEKIAKKALPGAFLDYCCEIICSPENPHFMNRGDDIVKDH